MSAIDGVLTQMEESSRKRSANIDRLIMTTCKSMSVLETWNHAKSKHPEAMVIIEGVQTITAGFMNAMSRSEGVAQRGAMISHEMVVFCDGMSDMVTTSEDLENFVSGMALPAKEAYRQAKDVETNFQEVREGLFTITNKIPAAVASVQGDSQHQLAKIRSAEKVRERAKFVKVCSSGLAAVFGGISTLTYSPALIILPIALPLVALVAGVVEKRMVMKIAERETRVQNCRDALETLRKAASDLVQLEECIDEFASFWTSIGDLLNGVVGRIELLRQSNAVRLRLMNLRSLWEEVARSYHDYAVKVEYLCGIVSLSMGSGAQPLSMTPKGPNPVLMRKE